MPAAPRDCLEPRYRSPARDLLVQPAVVVAAVRQAPAPAPVPDAQQQQQRRAELADREQGTYNAARGNLSALRAYINACTVCAFEADARGEISRLQTADQEERTYN